MLLFFVHSISKDMANYNIAFKQSTRSGTIVFTVQLSNFMMWFRRFNVKVSKAIQMIEGLVLTIFPRKS
jgi:hypothetical protein